MKVQHGMKAASRLYATISSGKELKGKQFLTLEHVRLAFDQSQAIMDG